MSVVRYKPSRKPLIIYLRMLQTLTTALHTLIWAASDGIIAEKRVFHFVYGSNLSTFTPPFTQLWT